jgi:hypothetical protein
MELYDYKPGSKSLIRPTEGTIASRLPPRIRIRKDAAIELPHIMVLIDDAKNEVLSGLSSLAAKEDILYDGDLMMGGGRVTGCFVPAEKASPVLAQSLSSLMRAGGKNNLLFAMGDGNHSLATAKAVWEGIKPALSPAQQKTHPARHALVEIVNLYDPGIEFHPIHRILSGVNPEEFFAFLRKKPGFTLRQTADFAETENLCRAENARGENLFHAGILSQKNKAVLSFEKKNAFLPTGIIQSTLEEFQRGKIDYIHGRDSLFALSEREAAVGLLLPALPKEKLFSVVIQDGALPRKAFSIGEAPEKRFYLEGRRIDGIGG